MQDPVYSVVQLSETCGMTHKFNTLSLGQGQAPVAAKLIKSALNEVSNRYIEDTFKCTDQS